MKKIRTFFLWVGRVLLGLFLLILLSCLVALVCSEYRAHMERQCEWTLDPVYSSNLSNMLFKDEIDTNSTNFKAIDVLRIYKNTSSRYIILMMFEVLSSQLVLETRDKAVIKKVLSSTQSMTELFSGCPLDGAGGRFYIVAFNEKTKQAGYFVLSPCNDSETMGIIATHHGGGDTSGIYRNERLIPVLKDLKVLP